MSSLTLALLIYAVAIVISFFVALLMKGMYFVMNLKQPKQDTSPESEPFFVSAGAEEVSPELIVLLSAAATTTLGHKARITRIQYRSARPSGGWATQGRMTVMTSHTIKR